MTPEGTVEAIALSELKALQQSLKKVEKALAGATKVFETAERRPIDELEKGVKALDAALAGLADRVRVEHAPAVAAAFRERISAQRIERSDVERRRRALAASAHSAGWPTDHAGETDYVGPFTVRHRPSESTVAFGSLRLLSLKLPSGEELMATLEASRSRLEAEANKGFEEFLIAALAAQQGMSHSEAVPWPAIVAQVVPDLKVRRRASKAILYRLSMLLSGQAPGNRRIQIAPPTLAEQRSAVSVPRLDRAHDDVRVYRVRLS
jgi:hypothetical protein